VVEEIKERNDTWKLVLLSKGHKMSVKWVYKGKKNAKSEVER